MRPLLLCLAAAVLCAAVDPDLPSLAPVVRAVFPHGAQRGTAAEIELTGQNLHDALSIHFAGRGVDAQILSSLGAKLKFKVTVAADAETGRRDFRLTTSRGVYVGVFDVGALPEILEKENNDDFRKPQPIALPVLVNGTLGNEDWDHFRFHAAAGETLIFDLSATRHGSRLDADLALLTLRGDEITWVDDTTIFGDPHIEHTFPAAGDYILRVGSLNGGGDYRLSAGRLPYVTRTLPAGLTAGHSTTLTLTGAHLDLVDELWIGDRLAKGQVLSKSPHQLQALFRLPANAPPGPSRIHASYQGREVAIPSELRISALPERTPAPPPLTRDTAHSVSAPVVVNGVITEPKSSHFYRFQAQAGQRFVFRAESMQLGYHLDPAITLLDAQGNKLAYADDPGIDDRSDEYQIDAHLSYTFQKTGTYFAAIRDGMYRGGELLLYRLTIERQDPNFILELREPFKTLYQGQQDTIQVRIRRRAGWDTPVEVWAENLFPGVTVDRTSVAPTDSIVKDTCGVDRTIDGTIAFLPARLSDAAAPGPFDIKIKARGISHGVTVEREAIVRYQNNSAGYVYGPMQVQRAQYTILPPPDTFLTTPDRIAIPPGGSRKMKVSVRRYGSARDAEIELRAAQPMPAGITVPTLRVPASAKEAEITIFAGPQAASGPIALEAFALVDNKRSGASAPFLVEIEAESTPEAKN